MDKRKLKMKEDIKKLYNHLENNEYKVSKKEFDDLKRDFEKSLFKAYTERYISKEFLETYSQKIKELEQKELERSLRGRSREKIKYCPKCGTPNKKDCAFCKRCGYKLQKLENLLNKKMSYKEYQNTIHEISKQKTRKLIIIIFFTILLLICFFSLILYYEMVVKSGVTGDPEVDEIIKQFFDLRMRNFIIQISFFGSFIFAIFCFFIFSLDVLERFGSYITEKYLLISRKVKKDYVTLDIALSSYFIPKIFKLIYIFCIAILIFPFLLFNIKISYTKTYAIIIPILSVVAIFVIYSSCLIKIGIKEKISKTNLLKIVQASNLQAMVSILFILLIVIPSIFLGESILISAANKGVSTDNYLKGEFVRDYEYMITKKGWGSEYHIANEKYFAPKNLYEKPDLEEFDKFFALLGLLVLLLAISFCYYVPVIYLKGTIVIYELILSFLGGLFLVNIVRWYFNKLSFSESNFWIMGLIIAIFIFLGKKYIDSLIKELIPQTRSR